MAQLSDRSSYELFALCSINPNVYLDSQFGGITEFTFRLLMNMYYRNTDKLFDGLPLEEWSQRIRCLMVSNIIRETISSYLSMHSYTMIPVFNITTNRLSENEVPKFRFSSKYGSDLVDYETYRLIEFNSVNLERATLDMMHMKNINCLDIAESIFPADDEGEELIRYEAFLNYVKQSAIDSDNGTNAEELFDDVYSIHYVDDNITLLIFIKRISGIEIGIYQYAGYNIAEIVKSTTDLHNYYIKLNHIPPFMKNINFRALLCTNVEVLEFYLANVLYCEVVRIKESRKRMNLFIIVNPETNPKLIDKDSNSYNGVLNPPNLSKSKSTSTRFRLKGKNKVKKLFMGYESNNEECIFKKETLKFEDLMYTIRYKELDDDLAKSLKSYKQLIKGVKYYEVNDVKNKKIIAISPRFKFALNWIILQQKIK